METITKRITPNVKREAYYTRNIESTMDALGDEVMAVYKNNKIVLV